MNSLLLKWSPLLKFAGNIDPTISELDRIKLYRYLTGIVNSYDKNNFPDMIRNLLQMKQLISDNIRPESLSPQFIDFLMDRDMWDYVDGSADTISPSNYDLTAANYLVKDLKEMLSKNQILNKNDIIEELDQAI